MYSTDNKLSRDKKLWLPLQDFEGEGSIDIRFVYIADIK